MNTFNLVSKILVLLIGIVSFFTISVAAQNEAISPIIGEPPLPEQTNPINESLEIQIQGNMNSSKTSDGTGTTTMIYLAVRKNLEQGVRVGGSYQKLSYEYSDDKADITSFGLDARLPLNINIQFALDYHPQSFADARYYQRTIDAAGSSYTDVSYGTYGGMYLTLSEFSSLAPGAGILLEKYDSKWNRDDTQSIVIFVEYKYYLEPDNRKLSIDFDYNRKSNSEETDTEYRVGLTVRF